jgi:hypothetical protein
VYELSLKVDDKGAVYSKGKVLHDTFAMPGEQWRITYTVQLNTDVLVLKTWNNVSTHRIALSFLFIFIYVIFLH